jgi:hypothetical protein
MEDSAIHSEGHKDQHTFTLERPFCAWSAPIRLTANSATKEEWRTLAQQFKDLKAVPEEVTWSSYNNSYGFFRDAYGTSLGTGGRTVAEFLDVACQAASLGGFQGNPGWSAWLDEIRARGNEGVPWPQFDESHRGFEGINGTDATGVYVGRLRDSSIGLCAVFAMEASGSTAGEIDERKLRNERLPRTVVPTLAAIKRVSLFIKSKSVTEFCGLAKITERTFRRFRKGEAVEWATIDSIARAMKISRDELLRA